MIKLTAILAAVTIVALASLAYGDMGGHGMGPEMMCGCSMSEQMMGSEHDMSEHLMDLNLDEQQKAFVVGMKSRMKKETIRRAADIRIAQLELKDLLAGDPVDMKAVEAKVRQLETMKTEIHLSHIKAMEECKTRLTPEQKKKLREMMDSGPMMEKKEMKHDHEHGMKGK